MKKANVISLLLVIPIFFILFSCDNALNSEKLNIEFKNIENPEFENIVQNKTYFSPLIGNNQVTLTFDSNKNSVLEKRYTFNNTDLVAKIECNKYTYMFSEDLKYLGLSLNSYYTTDSEGTMDTQGMLMSKPAFCVPFESLSLDNNKILWGNISFYTEEELVKSGYENVIKTKRESIYQKKENKVFEDKVKGKVFYDKFFPNIQSILQFDVDNNKVIYKQYYASRYNASLGPEDPPDYPFTHIYIKEWNYLWNEDNSKMALRCNRHYSTNMNGRLNDEYTDYTDVLSKKTYQFLNGGNTILKWDYDTFYTQDEMEKKGYPNYILHPVKPKR